ncbi:MAG TPA: thioesterase family protein [Steroidobacteraceae bacterium]|nr:thioesterase family protein [Steroidobacteraceae bacterium]
MPTATQLERLPLLARVRVPREWEDLNGHVNVQHHLGMYDMTSEAMLRLLGVSTEWVHDQQVGLVDLEHHIWFQRELHVGDEVALHLRFTALNERRVQGVVFLRNVASAEVASAIEFLSVAVDLAARRAIPVPSGVHERLVELLREHDALDWPAPRCGSISV